MPHSLTLLILALLIASTALFTLLYGYSVSPARLAKRIGPKQAYARCAKVRAIGIGFMAITAIAYGVFGIFPVELLGHARFPWGWPVSIAIGLGIAIFASLIMWQAARAAGSESFVPDRDTEMYGGIYTRVRHPQAIGDTLYYFAMAFGLNAPFLVAYSLVWIPIYYALSRWEERDLRLRFGAAYDTYMQSTGMFFPRRRP